VSLDHVQIKLYVLDPYVRSLLFIAGMLLSSDRPALVPVIWENKVVGLRYGTDPAKTSISKYINLLTVSSLLSTIPPPQPPHWNTVPESQFG
jgi:hypothetical protein